MGTNGSLFLKPCRWVKVMLHWALVEREEWQSWPGLLSGLVSHLSLTKQQDLLMFCHKCLLQRLPISCVLIVESMFQ